MNKFVTGFLSLVVLFATVSGVKYLTSAVATKQQVDSLDDKSTAPVLDEETARNQFVTNCDDGSINTADFSQNQYCQCMYTSLRVDYSVNELAKLGLTRDGSAEQIMAPYANKCVQAQGFEL